MTVVKTLLDLLEARPVPAERGSGWGFEDVESEYGQWDTRVREELGRLTSKEAADLKQRNKDLEDALTDNSQMLHDAIKYQQDLQARQFNEIRKLQARHFKEINLAQDEIDLLKETIRMMGQDNDAD